MIQSHECKGSKTIGNISKLLKLYDYYLYIRLCNFNVTYKYKWYRWKIAELALNTHSLTHSLKIKTIK